MNADYQKFHHSAQAAADYATSLKGWKGFDIRRMKDGTFRLIMEWEEKDNVVERKAGANDK